MESEKKEEIQEKAPLSETPVHAETIEGHEISKSPSTEDVEDKAANPDEIVPSPWTWKGIVTTLFLSGLYVGSQIPLYFVGATLQFIAEDLGGLDISSWLPVAYGLCLAAVAPFCGYMQDLMGRRVVTLIGGGSLCLGIIVLATAQSFGAGVVGMCFSGAGAAIGELTALAGTSELVPVNKRGVYLAMVTGFVLPFTPYLLYGQLLATYHSWRWGIWICLIWNGIAVAGIAILYFPKSQTRIKGEAAKAILKRIDYTGGFLSIVGLTLFLVALQAGGYTHPWASAYVLCPLIIGFFLMVAFVVWEAKFAKVPIVPREMFAGQRIVAMAYAIAFVAGMNFYALLNFFPLMFEDVFDPDPVQVGLKGLAPGLTTTIGAVFFNAALSWFKGRNRELLTVATIFMTAFGGALAAITPNKPGTAIALGSMAGFGVGGVLVPAATVAITVTPDTTIATCVALSLSIRAIGGSIGYAIYFNVFKNKLTANLPKYVAEYAVKAGLPLADVETFVLTLLSSPEDIAKVPGVTPAIIEGGVIGTRWAYALSLKYVWISSIPFGVVAIVFCLFIGNITKYMTNRVAATLQ